MLDKIVFKGYKSFKEKTEIELKPITVIFGKNSSGKSAIAKLPTLIEGSLSLEFDEPFMYVNKGIELGAEYRDLFFRREIQGNIDFELINGNDELKITVINTPSKPVISKWEIISEKMDDVDYNYKNLEEESISGGLKGFLIAGHPSEKIFKLKTDYLGPFRIKPQRIFYINDLKNPNSIDGMGEKAYHLIAKDEELEEKVSDWFKENFDGWELFVDRKQPYYEIKIRRNSEWDGINIVDVGQGMSQALPIIVKALYKNESEPILNILEQPELHLHPAAHGNLAELISNSIRDSKNRYLIETHSKNFILRLRTLIAKGELDYNALNLYFIDYDDEKDCSIVKKIDVTESGGVTSWPDHIFNESFEEAVALKLAQKGKKVIVKINSVLFNQSENSAQIDLLLNHILDRRYELFFDDEDVMDTSVWSNEARSQYKEILYEAFVNTLESSLSHDIELTDGDNVEGNKYSLENGMILLNNPVIIFLENATYDGYFIKGLIAKFKNRGKKIQSFLNKKWIRFENCGGKNNVINQINLNLSSFENDSLENYKYLRGIVIIDSDKKNKDEEYQDDNGIINFCEDNNILLHILEKREIENYLPSELFAKIDSLNQNELESFKKLTFDKRDFYDMEKLSTKEYNTKQKFPLLFLDEELLQEMILKNCEHQKLPDEPQLILDKINSLL